MILFLSLLLLFAGFSMADNNDKHPWSVKIMGNKVFSKFQLEEQLDIPQEFGQLDTSKQDFLMRLSIENMKALYYSRGYYSLDIMLDLHREYFTEDSTQRDYIFLIKEGERYKFGGLKILSTGSEKIPLDLTTLKTNQERNYSQDDISEDLQEIQRAYRSMGNLHVYLSSVEIVDTTAKRIKVEVNVQPGPKVVMGNIKTTTQRVKDRNEKDKTPEAGLSDTAWLSSLWKIKKGTIIDGNQYNSFKNKLYSTQLFTQIKMNDELREDGLSDVHLDVIERIPGEARYGFFFEEIYGFGAIAYARHKNFFGKFNEFSTNFQIAQHKQEISLGYANPLLFGTSFTFIPTAIRFEDRLSFNHEKISPPAYPDSTEERYEVINRGDLTFGITNNIHFRGTIDTRYVNKNGDNMFKLKGEIALTFDYTNDYFNPTKGIRISPTAGLATNFTKDESDTKAIWHPYTYAEATVNMYYPLFWTFYGALSGSAGKFFNTAIEDDARVFYQGGTRSVRGYRFRSIYASNTVEENGTEVIYTGLTPQYLRVNEEIRWTFPWRSLRQWQIVQFCDWTKVMDSQKRFSDTQKTSLGLGIRYKWQFLTFRLDYAFKKDLKHWKINDTDGFDWSRFAFDLSQAF